MFPTNPLNVPQEEEGGEGKLVKIISYLINKDPKVKRWFIDKMGEHPRDETGTGQGGPRRDEIWQGGANKIASMFAGNETTPMPPPPRPERGNLADFRRNMVERDPANIFGFNRPPEPAGGFLGPQVPPSPPQPVQHQGYNSSPFLPPNAQNSRQNPELRVPELSQFLKKKPRPPMRNLPEGF